MNTTELLGQDRGTIGSYVDDDVLGMVLAPYKPNCRYLKSAGIETCVDSESVARGSGSFTIPESCYIKDTGHFNAVEFNICYNQLMYSVLAQLIKDGSCRFLASWDLEQFKAKQLSHFLICNFSSSFRRPLSAKQFDGRVGITKASTRQGRIYLKTVCSFTDLNGATASGDAFIVIIEQSSL